jgi:hypothetical protein
VGFEPTVSAGERPQTYALARAATGTCFYIGSTILNLPALKAPDTPACAVQATFREVPEGET